MLGLADFREVWVIDAEFRAPPGERPDPVCMVGREYHSGRTFEVFRDDLQRRLTAPFDYGSATLIIAYFASAEMGVFLALGWPMPMNLICLYAEHRAEVNGLKLPLGNALIDAAAMRGLPAMEAATKEAGRRLVTDQASWTAAEAAEILSYCAADVRLTNALLERMAPAIDYPRALLRGRYMQAVARMEWAGIPLDTELHSHLAASWETIKTRLIGDIDTEFKVYDGTTFKADRFASYLARVGMPWPRYPSGQLMLDDDIFREQSRRNPAIYPLRQLRATLSGLRLTGLTIGSDGRNRCLLSPFVSVTGRNQPSNSKYIFGPAKWMRHLIKPPEGYGLAYIDWKSQELGIAAGRSGDERMVDGYLAGDPYMAFGRDAGLAPADATKVTHSALREQFKVVCLGVLYGMSAPAMAAQLGITRVEATDLMRRHHYTYPRFWRWSEAFVSEAMARRRAVSAFGWPVRVTTATKVTQIFNFPMQANGAEAMRLAAIAATEAGIEVCGPIHDAFLICAPIDRLAEDTERMELIMQRSGEAVAGIQIGTEAMLTAWPDRFTDAKGASMFARVATLVGREGLEEHEGREGRTA